MMIANDLGRLQIQTSANDAVRSLAIPRAPSIWFLSIGSQLTLRAPSPWCPEIRADHLRGSPIVEPQHASESLTPTYRAIRCPVPVRLSNELVPQTLVIVLRVAMHDELVNGPTQGRLPDQDHSIQAFVLDRAHEALGVRIQIGQAGRQPDYSGPCFPDHQHPVPAQPGVGRDDGAELQ